MERFKKNCCYVLKDEFFSKIEDSQFPKNKKGRPVICCCRDRKNPYIYWVVPLTTKVEKAAEIIEREGGKQKCFKYMLHKRLKNTAFNIQDAFPVSSKYIDHEYEYSHKVLQLKDKFSIDNLRKKMKIVLVKQMTNTTSWDSINVKKIFKMISKELKLEKEKRAEMISIGNVIKTKLSPKSEIISIDKYKNITVIKADESYYKLKNFKATPIGYVWKEATKFNYIKEKTEEKEKGWGARTGNSKSHGIAD